MSLIKDIEIIELGDVEKEESSPWSSTVVLVRMVTSDGFVGYGEAPTTMMTRGVYEQAKEVARVFKGREVEEVRKNCLEVYKHSFYLPVSMETSSALSAFEIASWDIIGKTHSMPAYEAFGGKCRDSIRAYANGWYSNCVTPADFLKKARAAVKMGFTALKFDPFGDAFDYIDEKRLGMAREIVSTLKEALPKIDLLIECHGRFNANSAIRAERALREFRPMFMEEPVHPDQFEGLLRFRSRSRTAVALGERVLDSSLFLNYLKNNAVDIIQPDVTNVGGMIQARNSAELAAAFGVEVAYHNAFGPIQTAATLNLDYAIPNFLIQESFEAFWPRWKKDLVASGYSLEKGFLKLEKGRPGLGIKINEKVLERQKISSMEPFNPDSPGWAVGGTFVHER